MKLLFILILAGMWNVCNCQQFVYQTQASNSITDYYTRDTVLAPDYYQVDITICERYACFPIGKRRCDYRKIGLDSLERQLIHELGLNHIAPGRISVLEVKSTQARRYNDDKPLFRKTFRIKIKSQDTVLSLFEKYKDNLFYGYLATPAIDNNTIEEIISATKDSLYGTLEKKMRKAALAKDAEIGSPFAQSCVLQKKISSDPLFIHTWKPRNTRSTCWR
jgi:hypothetical protein